MPNYARIAQPLIELTKKANRFSWNEDANKAFKTIQHEIVMKPSVAKPDYDKTFYLSMDASAISVGGILLQKDDGNFTLIDFFSRSHLHFRLWENGSHAIKHGCEIPDVSVLFSR